MLKQINFKLLMDKAKNILLAFFIFGSIGAYFGAHYANQINTQLLKANKDTTATAAGKAPQATPVVQTVK